MLDDLFSLYHEMSSRSLRFYLDHVVINASPEPRAWRLCREPWQDDILRHKVPILEALARLPGATTPARWNWCDVLPRGHDKSSLEGRLSSWLLLYSRRRINGYILAADKDQGELILQAMNDEAQLNPWVAKHLTFSRNKVIGPRGFVEVLPADAGSAFGLRGNWYICDELTNWRKPSAHEMWKAVVSGMGKVRPCAVGILSNAGFVGTWQEKVVNALRDDPLWHYYSAPGPLASWMDPTVIASLKAKLASPAEGRRVYENQWINAGADLDYLTPEEVKACEDAGLMYRFRRAPGVKNYVASIDYGPKRDRTVCLVGHMEQGGGCVVDRMDVFTGEVPPSTVENWVKDIDARFAPVEYVIDPYQMLSVIENMKAKGLPVHEWAVRGGQGNFEIAQALRGSVVSRQIRWYPRAGLDLHDELANLVCKKMGYGFRIDHTSTRHDDQAVALGMFLVRAQEHPWQ